MKHPGHTYGVFVSVISEWGVTGAMLTLAVKPQWVRYKLDETIQQSCSDFLAHTSKVCKGAHRYNKYLAIQGESRFMGNVYNLCRV
jgi:hypothetical protein